MIIKKSYYTLIILASAFLVAVLTEETPIVDIPGLGKIRGTTRTTFKNSSFFSFEGVPYAAPPVGALRFEEPKPPKPWRGTREATTIFRCTQNFEFTPIGENPLMGQEDCLYLNIYTPTLDRSASLDVLVYIHGGGFMFYWGGHGPDYILTKNIVHINLNYRLGPLGFLSTEDNVVPGNNGLKDQTAALFWIKKHVRSFGGNPDSITIGGFSAGSASVVFHLLSPLSRNLFHRAICESGTLINPWALTEAPLEKAKRLASYLRCSTRNTKQMVDCLRERSANNITAVARILQPFLYNPFTPFGPVVDSWSRNPVLPVHPYKLLKTRRTADVPLIASYTNSEGLYPASEFYVDEGYLKEIDNKWNRVIPFILDYNYTVKQNLQDRVSKQIRDYYLGQKAVDRENFLDFVNILSDRHFLFDIRKTYRLLAKANKSPIYFYYFTYRGAHSNSEMTGSDRDFGAAHADDTTYIFKTLVDTISTAEDRQMVELLTEMVASFVKTGKPNVPARWVPMKPEEKFKFLKIASPYNLTMEASSLTSEKFWEKLPIEENEKLFRGFKFEK